VILVLFFIQAAHGLITVHIDFEDLGVAPGAQLNPLPGVNAVSMDFSFNPGPDNDSGFNDLHISNGQGDVAFNGTTVLGSHDDLVLTHTLGEVFNLKQFDFSGFPENQEATLTLVGTYADLSTTTQVFVTDGWVDGIGGVTDFETFFALPSFTDLISVTWLHSGGETEQGLFSLDNVILEIPEPSALCLLVSSLILFRSKKLRQNLHTAP
jgi:hypothetical protein